MARPGDIRHRTDLQNVEKKPGCRVGLRSHVLERSKLEMTRLASNLATFGPE